MQNILNQIQQNIEAATAIIVSLAALAILVITKYKEIKAALSEAYDTAKNASKNKAKIEAVEAALPLIAKAVEDPIGLAHNLVNKDALPTDPSNIPAYVLNKPDDAKKNIVAQALIERNPKTLKKLKLKDLLQVGNFVSDVYQMVKPVIKSIKK